MLKMQLRLTLLNLYVSKMETLKRPLNYKYYYCQPDSVFCTDLVNDSVFFIDLINAYFMSFIWLAWFGIYVLVSVYYSLLWHATTLVSFIYTWSLLPTKLFWLLYSDWFTSYLIRALITYHSQLVLLLNHVVIVVKLCCVEGLMEDRCTSKKHSR